MITFNYLGKLGQLGNQMFQYAATKGIATHLGYDFMIPDHDEIFDDGIGNKLRIELDGPFTIDCKRGMIPTRDVREPGFEFSKKFFDRCPDNVNLFGFFQTEKYFKHIEGDIRNDFVFKKQIRDECQEIVEGVFNDPIALHIRRGDFLINSGNHHNLTLEYYKKALSKFDPHRDVIIFTDDPDWAKAQDLFKPDRFIISEGNSSYHDLYLMTQCSSFIIANSSFSWWGAWLGNGEEVIAPSIWFGPNNSHLNTKDLYPRHWKLV